MEMEIWERGVLKRQKMTTPATTYSPRSLHTQTTLTVFLSKFAERPAFKPSLYLFYVFHGKREKTPDRRLFAKEKKYVRIYSAALQSWRELSLKQSHTALFEKDLELLVIANATVFSQTEPSFSLSTRTMHVIPA